MDADPSARAQRSGGLLLASVVAAVLAGGAGWYFYSQRGDSAADSGGFDLSSAPKAPAPVSPAPAPAPTAAAGPARPASGLAMVRGDEYTRPLAAAPRPASSAAPSAAPAPSSALTLEDSRRNFTAAARKHEASVRAFAARMTAKYPVIRQYGKDWMSRPDLKKLNDDYMRDRDPIAFLSGLARAPSFPGLVKQYSRSPEVREFVITGIMKEAPSELVDAALDLMQKDGGAKTLVAAAASGLGLPPSLAAAITGDPAKIDQKKVLKDISESPAAREAGAGR